MMDTIDIPQIPLLRSSYSLVERAMAAKRDEEAGKEQVYPLTCICPHCGTGHLDTPISYPDVSRCRNCGKPMARVGETELRRLKVLAEPFVDGFKSDPGTSDLYNEQPITVRVTLGDWRKLRAALAKIREGGT